jgi:uncharacterized protein (TIGR02099 family)
MTEQTARVGWLGRSIKTLFGIVGGLAILLALALGVFRLLVAQIPEYQTELKAWVAAELGVVVDFAELDARLGLAGPELTLRSASIGDGERGGFLLADRAAITLDPLALVLTRQVSVSRLTLDGVQLTVERGTDGRLRLGEHAIDPSNRALAGFIPESVAVVIRNSRVLYLDAGTGRSWQFEGVELAIESTPEHVRASATARPPASLAARVDLALAAMPAGDERGPLSARLDIAADALDLAGLAELVAIPLAPPLQGSGNVGAALEWTGRELRQVGLTAELAGLAIGPDGASDTPYESLSFAADWQSAGAAGWTLALTDVALRRGGRAWPVPAGARFAIERGEAGPRAVSLASEFIRLEDLAPFVLAFPETQLAEQWALFDPRGDVSGLEFSLERPAADIDYELAAAFEGLAVARVAETPGLTGLTGRVEANAGSGTIEFASGALGLDWPLLFPDAVAADSLTGAVVWRQGRDVLRVFSVDLALGLLDGEIRSSFDLSLPLDGGSATLDLEARLAEVELVPAKRYLPTAILPDAVTAWLEHAVRGGRARDIELGLFGPLDSFPFDDGRGQFRIAADVEGVTLDYMSGWPPAEDLAGRIEFVNAGFAATGTGRVLTNLSRSVSVAIPDMRAPLFTLAAETQGPLEGVVGFLRGAPLIAAHLGPDFERLAVRSGDGAISARLDLPLMNLSDYVLDAALGVTGGAVEISGLGPGIREINGTIRADRMAVTAEDVDALFLGGPVSVDLRPSDEPGYRAVIDVEGETTAEGAMRAFSLPHEALFAGQTLWRGRLYLPALDPLATMPPRIEIESNLAGVALRLPEPLAKPPSEPSNLHLDLQFSVPDRLEVRGNLGAARRFAASFQVVDDVPQFLRGAVQFGGDEPKLPVQAGILLGGRLHELELDAWLSLAKTTRIGRAGPLFLGADLEIGELNAYGQRLGASRLRIERGAEQWEIDLDSEAIAGEISVPRDLSRREAVVADMSRVYLATVEDGEMRSIDPRTLPGLVFSADAFGFGTRELGRVEARLEPDPRGLRLAAFRSETEHLVASLTGTWLQGSRGTRTTIEAELDSSDVEAALGDLGLDPVIAGESARVLASVYWDAAPSGDWLDHLHGEVGLYVETGSLREVDPGAGRVVGLMSIAALPRRLLLDFRDVFEEGFAFDEISGDFRIIDGNAYTDNLKFGGPGAEIGVVGRTGLRDRDYQQQVVVTAEPSNMLPTVGGLIGGPGVGAALLIFTRLFKEPLKGIGRASYCLTGSWDAPDVVRIDNDAKARAERCAELPAETLEVRDD